jgi:hypothetical protein
MNQVESFGPYIYYRFAPSILDVVCHLENIMIWSISISARVIKIRSRILCVVRFDVFYESSGKFWVINLLQISAVDPRCRLSSRKYNDLEHKHLGSGNKNQKQDSLCCQIGRFL